MAKTLRKEIVKWVKEHSNQSSRDELGLTDAHMNQLIDEAHSFRFEGNKLILFFEDCPAMSVEFEDDHSGSHYCAILYKCGDYKRRL